MQEEEGRDTAGYFHDTIPMIAPCLCFIVCHLFIFLSFSLSRFGVGVLHCTYLQISWMGWGQWGMDGLHGIAWRLCVLPFSFFFFPLTYLYYSDLGFPFILRWCRSSFLSCPCGAVWSCLDY